MDKQKVYTEYNHYVVKGDLDSRNAGFSRWGKAWKNGSWHFLKEFLSPVYPEDAAMFSEDMLVAKRNFCREYETKMTSLYKAVNQASDGNLVRIDEFFRCGGKYYTVMGWQNTQSSALSEISGIRKEKKEELQQKIICRALLHSLMKLHEAGVVHGDLKPANILLVKTKGNFYTAKIIDFDNAFPVSEPPHTPDELKIDITYLSPEAYRFLKGEKIRIGTPIDVFAAGLYLYGLLTGFPGPVFSSGKSYEYGYQGILNGDELFIPAIIRKNIRELLYGCLEPDPDKRLTAEQAFELAGGSAEAEEVRAVGDRNAIKKPEANKQTDGFTEAGNL